MAKSKYRRILLKLSGEVLAGEEGYGINVVTGESVNMIEEGIIEPVLVTKSALKNGTTLKEEAVKSGLITEKEFLKFVNPKKMTKPNF